MSDCAIRIGVCERRYAHEIMLMSFVEILDNLALRKSELVERFEHLITPKSDQQLEAMAQSSSSLTLQNFGRTMRLFAPLYLSNECINNCQYCGFSRDNPILRVTLDVDEVIAEARHLARQGFRQILLVTGEHPKFAGHDYLAECVRALAPDFSSISIEVGPMETEDYMPIVEAGAEGLVVYQETYNRGIYAEMHTAGPKRDFNFRLDCVERGYAAGFRRLGVGALIGLSRWQDEAIALAAHLEYLFKRCWQAQITVSLPRLRPAAGGFHPLFSMTDRELVQLVCALRITFPQLGIVLSTRERAFLRDSLVSIGVTMMSAGSHTEPGGYTRQGRVHLHRTVRGRFVAPEYQDGEDELATGQFAISDERSPAEIAAVLRRRGLEPVWKDWDQALCGV
jgi:2-iminoacetate synthase